MTWNATVLCIKEFNPGKGSTLGKKYKVKNGRIKYDNGEESMNEFEDINHLNSYNSAKYEIAPARGKKVKSSE